MGGQWGNRKGGIRSHCSTLNKWGKWVWNTRRGEDPLTKLYGISLTWFVKNIKKRKCSCFFSLINITTLTCLFWQLQIQRSNKMTSGLDTSFHFMNFAVLLFILLPQCFDVVLFSSFLLLAYAHKHTHTLNYLCNVRYWLILPLYVWKH